MVIASRGRNSRSWFNIFHINGKLKFLNSSEIQHICRRHRKWLQAHIIFQIRGCGDTRGKAVILCEKARIMWVWELHWEGLRERVPTGILHVGLLRGGPVGHEDLRCFVSVRIDFWILDLELKDLKLRQSYYWIRSYSYLLSHFKLNGIFSLSNCSALRRRHSASEIEGFRS